MVVTDTLLDFFLETRKRSEEICQPLQTEDYVVQPIVDVSPPKWHLGHTTWFFEEFILKKHLKNYQQFDQNFAYVFNSYYESMGKRVVRTDRGNLSRPTVKEVYTYRAHIDQAMKLLFDSEITDELLEVLEIGIHHEKQHQELLLTDIKYILGHNPLLPAYSNTFKENKTLNANQHWIEIEAGNYQIGHNSTEFCYDNELGRHTVYVADYLISDRLVSNAEYLQFVEDGGYQNHEFWHAEAWDWVKTNNINAPMYWHKVDGNWHQYSLNGLQPIDMNAAVTHISYFEAFAYAQHRGLRLATEFEWEIAQSKFDWGHRWEWTESAYLPYPGYTKADGALGEYNGKFMVNQKVLRGGSVATPIKHTRSTYRNFFQPELRWQFTGIRLAK